MYRFWLLIWLLCSGASYAAENIELYGESIESCQNVSVAKGGVLVFYQEYYLSADEARYDRETGELELQGNITMMKANTFHAMGEYMKLDIQKKEQHLEPFFLLDKISRVWMSTKEADALKDDFDLSGGMLSGCNPTDPFWKIHFGSSDYNSETKWMNIYHARLHIYDIPLFYVPYFGYSLDTSRRSGLLTPSLGVSSSEGFFFQQPLYIVLSNSSDLELKPQFRTERGNGLYTTLRFVDSNSSFGTIRGGVFQEHESYAKSYALANKEHYGYSIDYENHRFLQEWFGMEVAGQSGLFTDITWMNDVDYLNLEDNDETKNITSNQIFSRINLFYNTEEDYIGTYFKYFLDLSKQDNSDTIQNLPIVEYHHYLETLMDNFVIYNFSVNVNNYYRETGKTAVQGSVDLPIMVQTSLFDDYLDLSYKAQLHGRYITFSGEGDPLYSGHYQSGLYGKNYHTVDVGTYLAKGYDGFSHAVALNAVYLKDGDDYRSGYYKNEEANCSITSGELEPCEYYNISGIDEKTALQFTQYLFDQDGEQVLYHRLSQAFSYDSATERLSELENELEYQINKTLSYYNNTFFNHQRNIVTKALNALRYNDEEITLRLDHLYENQTENTQSVRASYMTGRVEYRFDRHYRYFAGYAYDFENLLKKGAEIGFMYTKRCWDFGLRYVENRRPILTDTASSSVYDKYVYFTIMLKPIGGSEFSYKLGNLLEGS